MANSRWLAQADPVLQISIFLNFERSVEKIRGQIFLELRLSFSRLNHTFWSIFQCYTWLYMSMSSKNVLFQSNLNFEFSLQRLGAVTGTPTDPAPVLLSGINCSTSHGRPAFRDEEECFAPRCNANVHPRMPMIFRKFSQNECL